GDLCPRGPAPGREGVAPATGEQPAVRAEGHAADLLRGELPGTQLPAAGHVPDLHGTRAEREQLLTVRAEGQGDDFLGLSFEPARRGSNALPLRFGQFPDPVARG